MQNITYFKFKRGAEFFILPVYKDSLLYKTRQFYDKEVLFISEVSEAEYEDQFKTPQKNIQLEFEF